MDRPRGSAPPGRVHLEAPRPVCAWFAAESTTAKRLEGRTKRGLSSRSSVASWEIRWTGFVARRRPAAPTWRHHDQRARRCCWSLSPRRVALRPSLCLRLWSARNRCAPKWRTSHRRPFSTWLGSSKCLLRQHPLYGFHQATRRDPALVGSAHPRPQHEVALRIAYPGRESRCPQSSQTRTLPERRELKDTSCPLFLWTLL